MPTIAPVVCHVLARHVIGGSPATRVDQQGTCPRGHVPPSLRGRQDRAALRSCPRHLHHTRSQHDRFHPSTSSVARGLLRWSGSLVRQCPPAARSIAEQTVFPQTPVPPARDDWIAFVRTRHRRAGSECCPSIGWACCPKVTGRCLLFQARFFNYPPPPHTWAKPVQYLPHV